MAYKIKRPKLPKDIEWKSYDDKGLIKIVGGLTKDHYSRASRYGERAWRVHGKKMDLIVWDQGNSWYGVMKVLWHKRRK